MKDSSIEALQSVNAKGTKQIHYQTILKVFDNHKNTSISAVDITLNCELTRHQVSRRLSEMVRLNLIEFNGYKMHENFSKKFSKYKLTN